MFLRAKGLAPLGGGDGVTLAAVPGSADVGEDGRGLSDLPTEADGCPSKIGSPGGAAAASSATGSNPKDVWGMRAERAWVEVLTMSRWKSLGREDVKGSVGVVDSYG